MNVRIKQYSDTGEARLLCQ